MSGYPLIVPKPQFFDQNGNPLTGGTLESYLDGGVTPEPLYSDGDATIAAGTSFELNARGEPLTPLFAKHGTAYTFVLKDALGVTIYSVDGYTLTQERIYPDEVGETGVVNTAYPRGNVLRYGTNTAPGTTDMTTAFQNAALSSLMPYAPEGDYKITGSIPLRDNQHWKLDGARIAITGNTKVFTAAAGIDDWSIDGQWQVTGDNNNAGSLSGSGATVEITDSKHWYVGGQRAFNIKGYGIHVLPGASTSPRAEHGVIDHPQCFACTIGIGLDAGTQPGAEYVTVNSPIISRCGTGMAVAAGNHVVNSPQIADNTVNVEISAGANHAHGIFSGGNINHPAAGPTGINIRCIDVTNGQSFIGCHIFEGVIHFDECAGVVIANGVFAPSNIINDTGASSSYNFVVNNYMPSGYTTQVTSNNSGQHELKAYDNYGPGSYDINTGFSINDPSQVYVLASRAAASTQALVSGAPATLIFPTEDFDRSKSYNNATGVFTVPAGQAGTYRIRANAIFSGTAMSVTASFIDVKINGVSTALFLPKIHSTDKLEIGVDFDIRLAVGDTVALVATITGTSPVFGQTTWGSRLSLERIA